MFIMMPLTTFLILLFIYMIYRSFVEDNRKHHQAQMQAQFFCCPQCNAKYMPKNMIVGEDKKLTEMLMVCKKCSSKGVFKIKSFHLLCCNICNNKIESPDGSRWWHTEKGVDHNTSIKSIPDYKCKHCDTFNITPYIPNLSPSDKGIIYAPTAGGVFEKVFVLILVGLFLTLFIGFWFI